MSLTLTINAMVAAGCSIEQVAAVVAAHEAGQAATAEARRASKRAGNADRQRRHRENNANNAVTARDKALQAVTARDTPSLDKEIPPTPPKEIKPSPDRDSLIESARASAKGDFEEFFSAYPKRVNRKSAFARYETARRAGVEHARIMAGEKLWIAKWAADHTEQQFIPAPDVWLNKAKYDDEVLPEVRAGPRSGPSSDAPLSPKTQAYSDFFHEPDHNDKPPQEASSSHASGSGGRVIGWIGSAR